MGDQVFIVLLLIGYSLAQDYPCWPSQFQSGYDTANKSLGDNYFCAPLVKYNYGKEFRHYLCVPEVQGIDINAWTLAQNGALSNMNCINIDETAVNYTSSGKYFCVPRSWPYNFQWSNKGCIGGKHCMKIDVQGEPEWDDNYLCSDVSGQCSNFNITNQVSTYCASSFKSRAAANQLMNNYMFMMLSLVATSVLIFFK